MLNFPTLVKSWGLAPVAACLATACFAAIAFATPASASAALSNGEKFGDFVTECPADPKVAQPCHISQIGKDTQGNQVVELILVNVPSNDVSLKPASKLVFVVPLGAILPNGITVQFDADKPLKLPFFQCTPNGCQSPYITMDDGTVKKLKGGKKITMSFIAPNMQPETASVTLNGVSAAIDALAKDVK